MSEPQPAPPLLRRLPDGPVDVIGDVHGELHALEALLGHLDELARSEGRARNLVFVGDLVDRGPDSPGVVRRVRDLVAAGRAHCVLGNHDLNALRADVEPRQDNGWMRGERRHLGDGTPIPEEMASPAEVSEVLEFLRGLPLALEREDLRVVHAAWCARSVEALAGAADARALHDEVHASIEAELELRGILHAAEEDDQRRLRYPVPPLATDAQSGANAPIVSASIQERELALQNDNPVRVLTSGLEVASPRVFAAGPKWRDTTRKRWWEAYVEGPAVVVGHYWRGAPARGRGPLAPPEAFREQPAHGPIGPLDTPPAQRRVWCIDYSVGRRYLERAHGRGREGKQFHGRLCALRWPEGEQVFDDGQVLRAGG